MNRKRRILIGWIIAIIIAFGDAFVIKLYCPQNKWTVILLGVIVGVILVTPFWCSIDCRPFTSLFKKSKPNS